MKLKLKHGLCFLFFGIVPVPSFAGTGGAWDDEIAILGLAFLFLSGIGVAYLIKYTKEKILPAMYVIRNSPVPAGRRAFDGDEGATEVSGDVSESVEGNSGMKPEL